MAERAYADLCCIVSTVSRFINDYQFTFELNNGLPTLTRVARNFRLFSCACMCVGCARVYEHKDRAYRAQPSLPLLVYRGGISELVNAVRYYIFNLARLTVSTFSECKGRHKRV